MKFQESPWITGRCPLILLMPTPVQLRDLNSNGRLALPVTVASNTGPKSKGWTWNFVPTGKLILLVSVASWKIPLDNSKSESVNDPGHLGEEISSTATIFWIWWLLLKILGAVFSLLDSDWSSKLDCTDLYYIL